jgi:hypothetical protein
VSRYRLKNTLELRKAQQVEAAIQYQKTTTAPDSAEAPDRVLAPALIAARERYSDGVGDFLTVLGAERTLLQAGQQYVTSTTNVSLNLVQLFKALRGGWN